MSIVKMDRLTVVGLKSQQEAIMEALMRLGAVELDPAAADENGPAEPATPETTPGEGSQYEKLLARLTPILADLERLDTSKKPLFSQKRSVSSDDFMAVSKREQELHHVMAELEKGKEQAATLRSSLHRLDTRLKLLQPWEKVDIDLADPGVKSSLLFWGSFDSREACQSFLSQVQSQAPETGVEVFEEGAHGLLCIVYTLKDLESPVRNQLRRFGFDFLPLQGQQGTPRQLMEAGRKQQAKDEKHLTEIEKRQQEAVALLPDLKLLHDFWSVRGEKQQTIDGLATTQQTFWLQGWVPASLSQAVRQGLKDHFVVATTARPARKGEDHPILLSNNRFVKSYEVIVEMFSPPSTREIDPAPLLAPFFFITFGMMLSDVGYGLLMSLLCALLLFKVKVRGEMARMSRMLMLSGIASIIWGLVFGGFFGDVLSVVSGERIQFPALWFNPMDDPTLLMIFTMVFGVIHLFAGMAAKAYMSFQTGDWQAAVFDIFPWFLIIVGLGLMLAELAGSVGLAIVIVAVSVLVLFGGRQEKNPLKRLLKGIMSLYGITGYFSDILSYTRILALVLATSVVAMVVNLLGFLLGPTPVGIAVFIVVAIGGHVLNLAISALSAYVHTSRLHFVEFFSKFYEGGGRLWQPLRIETKYVQIDKEP